MIDEQIGQRAIVASKCAIAARQCNDVMAKNETRRVRNSRHQIVDPRFLRCIDDRRARYVGMLKAASHSVASLNQDKDTNVQKSQYDGAKRLLKTLQLSGGIVLPFWNDSDVLQWTTVRRLLVGDDIRHDLQQHEQQAD